MGLTIHYEFESKTEPGEQMRAMHAYALQMKEEGLLSSVSDLKYRDFTSPDERPAAYHEIVEESPDRALVFYNSLSYWRVNKIYRFLPEKIYSFVVWWGEGCESTEIALATHEGFAWGHGKRIKSPFKPGVWRGRSFTKTTYATHPVSAHLAVVALLDEAKRLGILKRVSDEGDYWKNRDLSELAKNFSSDHVMLAAFAERMTSLLSDTDMTMVAPIKDRADYNDLLVAASKKSTLEILRALKEKSDE